MTARIVIDRARCIGAGACLVAAPQSFALDASGRATLRIETGHDALAVRLAVESCPLGALELVVEPETGVVAFAPD